MRKNFPKSAIFRVFFALWNQALSCSSIWPSPTASVDDRTWLVVSLQVYLQDPIEFGKDSHSKFPPTPCLPFFLVDLGVHYLKGWNSLLETVGIIFYMWCMIQRFHPKLNKSFFLPQSRFLKVKTQKEGNASNVALRTTSRV